MDLIWEGIRQAAVLLMQGDPYVVGIALRSIQLSGLATAIGLFVAVPLGTILALTRFPGRRIAVVVVNTGMSLPPVVVGLVVSMTLWRSGPLGFLEMLYTPGAIVLAQFVITFPVITGLTMASIQQIDPKLRLQLQGLGASRLQVLALLVWEARLPMMAAVIAGFGAAISEVGAVMMVGGNILGYSRVLTTATVLETRKGNFDTALALGLILLGIAFLVTWALTFFQQRGAAR